MYMNKAFAYLCTLIPCMRGGFITTHVSQMGPNATRAYWSGVSMLIENGRRFMAKLLKIKPIIDSTPGDH